MNSRDPGSIAALVLAALVLFPYLAMGLAVSGISGPGMMGRWGFGLVISWLLLVVGVALIILAFNPEEPRSGERQEILRARRPKGDTKKKAG